MPIHPTSAVKREKTDWESPLHLKRMSQIKKNRKSGDAQAILNILERAEEERHDFLYRNPSQSDLEKICWRSTKERGSALIAGSEIGNCNLVKRAADLGGISPKYFLSSLKISVARGFSEIVKILLDRKEFSVEARGEVMEKLINEQIPLTDSVTEAAWSVLGKGAIPDPIRKKLIEKGTEEDAPYFVSALLQTADPLIAPSIRHFALQKAADLDATQCLDVLFNQEQTSVDLIDSTFLRAFFNVIQEPLSDKKITFLSFANRISKKTLKFAYDLAQKREMKFFTPGPYEEIQRGKITSDLALQALNWANQMLKAVNKFRFSPSCCDRQHRHHPSFQATQSE